MANMHVAQASMRFPPFPPLKKGGRGDLLFMHDKNKSPLIPLLQRGKTLSSGATP